MTSGLVDGFDDVLSKRFAGRCSSAGFELRQYFMKGAVPLS